MDLNVGDFVLIIWERELMWFEVAEACSPTYPDDDVQILSDGDTMTPVSWESIHDTLSADEAAAAGFVSNTWG